MSAGRPVLFRKDGLSMYKRQIYRTWFLMPAFILYVVLFIIPVLTGIGYSFTNWNALNGEMRFIGLRNYAEIFNPDNAYMLAIRNTLLFTVFATLGKIILGLLLALFFNRSFKSQQLMRGVYFMPFAISSLIIGMIFTSILAPKGILNEFLRSIHLGTVAKSWLTNRQTALGAVIAVEIWKSVGLNMVIFLAGLQMISKEYYEAAQLDGATAFGQFRYITWPFLQPSVTINVILNTIHGLKVFDIVMSLTDGGPGNTTQVISTFVFKTYGMGAYGLSNALSTFIFLLTTVIALATLRLIAPKEG